MGRQIVTVLSTNYAGSHFLALQLASHSRAVSLGELHRFKRSADRRRQACSICPDDASCPVFHGLEGVPLGALYDRVFANLEAMDPRIALAVDNSKKPEWARRFLDLEGYTRRYIHLIRDPRALVRRWMLCYESAAEKSKVRRLMARRCWRRAWQILRGPEDNVYVHKWAYQNRRISRFLERFGLDARVITYQDLVLFPEQTLEGLMAWLGLTFEPDQLHYWTKKHHGSQKPQYMRPPPDGVRFHDLRWREYLAPEVRRRIADHREVRPYLAELGIVMTETGLTRHPGRDSAAPDSPGHTGEGAS
ncbi:MAG: hypothetical protein JXR77_19500 [Lentisphaeria bacterium]|nr:hypothetical protein [Lentisphaeria bacterium]